MMRCPPFRYFAPRTLAEATSILAGEGPDAAVLAGGTDLVPNMKRRQQTPRALVAVGRIAELSRVAVDGPGTVIGACATLSEVTCDARIRAGWRALTRAAEQVATPHLRNMGTVGGNLCLDTRCNYYDQSLEWRTAIDGCMKAPGPALVARAVPAGDTVCWVAPGSPRCLAVSSTDTAPALIALGARVSLASAAGRREIPLEELYADDGMSYLTKRPDEILAGVRLAAPAQRSTYWKLRRRGSFDFPVLSVAIAASLAPGGSVAFIRVVLGAVASRPVLVPAAQRLIGKPLDDGAVDSFAAEAAKLARPLDNTDFALAWRKRVARTFIAGALREIRGDDPQTLGLHARGASRSLPVV